MMMDQSQSNLIDKYLHEGLSGKEETQFQTLMQNPEFAEEVSFRQKLVKASRELGRSELNSFLQDLDQEMDEEEETPTISMRSGRNRWYYFAGIAASILILISFFLWPGSSSTDQELFAAHYQTFPNLIDPNDRSGDAKNEALSAYERKDFQEAVRQFRSLSEMNQEERLYFGLSLMMAENTDAIQELKTVAADPAARYQQAAQWYLALAHLRAGDRKAARTMINEILATPDHSYQRFARELEKDL